MKTVKEVSAFAGISVRTLHYYDEIGLLRPRPTGDTARAPLPSSLWRTVYPRC